MIGKLPGTGACVSLRYAFGEGVDAVEVGSYRNETGGVVWTEVPKDKAEIGLRVCGMTCGDHCAAHGSCGSCGGDAQCGWCPASGRCLSRDAALDGCPDFANDASDDTVGECLDECHSAVSCATCANRPGCGWCRSSGTCHGANAAGEQLAGLTCAPDARASFLSDAKECDPATATASRACPGAIDGVGSPAFVGHQPVPAMCNGRGACDESTGRCSCERGWAGAACEIRCAGRNPDAPCGGGNRGRCDALDGSCHCKPGYAGVGCEIRDDAVLPLGECACGIARAARDRITGETMQFCTGRVAESAAGARFCSCREGWWGADCDAPCPGSGPRALNAPFGAPESMTCGGRGTCAPPRASARATRGLRRTRRPPARCAPATCAAGTCPPTRGRCVFDPVAGLADCLCKGGFTGQGCNTCACLNGGTCNDITAECECAPGFGGTRCETPAPSDAEVANACGANGAYNAALARCVCDAGFVGAACEYACDSETDCGGRGVCASDGTCQCAAGFEGASCGSCASGYVDFPHCAAFPEAGSDQCHDPADPSAFRGESVRFTRDGRRCQRWDAQAPIPHPYAPNATGMAALGVGAHDFCRNPTGDPLQWCLVDHASDRGTRKRDDSTWEYCAAPACFDLADPAEAPWQCTVFGEMAAFPFTGAADAVSEAPRAEADANACQAAALALGAGKDVRLIAAPWAEVHARTAVGAATARVYVESVAVKADATANRPKIVVSADMTMTVDDVDASLPWAGASASAPVVTAFATTAFSTTGLTSYGATMRWIDGLVVDLVSTACEDCGDAKRRLEVNVKVDAVVGGSAASADTLCGGAGVAASVADCADASASAHGSCPSAGQPSDADVLAACQANVDAASPDAPVPAPSAASIAEGRAACRQCSRLGGVEASCLAQLRVLGAEAMGSVADACRARFRERYGYERPASLDPRASPWGAFAAGGSDASTVVDTVAKYSPYPSTAAFERYAASASIISESEYVVDPSVLYIAGTRRVVGAETKTRGIPFRHASTTKGRAAFPFPSVEDSCRGPADVVSGSGGFAVYKLEHGASADQNLRATMCGTSFPSVVGVYAKEYVEVSAGDFGVDGATGDITVSFEPWREETRYEVRLRYATEATASEAYELSYVVGAGGSTVSVGTFALPVPAATVGESGFATEPLAGFAAGDVVNVLFAAPAGASAVTLLGATVRAENAANARLGYPPFGGYKQVACGAFSANACGEMTFTAERNSEYFFVVSGRGSEAASGAYDVQLMKTYGQITTLRTTSNNPALSLVRSTDGSVDRPTAYKLAKIGDALTIRVEAGRAIDKPEIRVGGVLVRPGLVVGSGSAWEASFVVRRTHGFADGELNVTADPPATLTDPSRGFEGSALPRGSDKALVMFDGTPPRMLATSAVNAAYLDALNVNAPDDCKDSDDVKVTAAKAANVGSTVAVAFHADEPLASVSARVGGLDATVLMRLDDPAPIEVKRVRDAWRAYFTAAADAATPVTEETFGVAYVELTADVVQQGNVEFEIAFADAAGNVGTPQTTVLGAPPGGVGPQSSLEDRLRSDFVEFDSFVPRRIGNVALSHASSDQALANADADASAFHVVQEVTRGSLAYRLGDVIVADVAWTEPVTRPYGAYFQLAANGKQHLKQADVTLRALARATRAGARECRQTEFRPRAQEAKSRAAGWGGRGSFQLEPLASTWRVTARLTDPCDVVGRGALAWARRNDCRAEDRGDGSFWIPMWARWCREGWGTMGYSLPEVYDASGNKAADFAVAPRRVNNAKATDVVAPRTNAGDVIVRAPVVLQGKNAPSVAVAGQKQPQNVAPSVVELYAEPSAFVWNMYRRVVRAGDYVVFHFYLDQPASHYRLWIGDYQRLARIEHEAIAPAYAVHKPCAEGANLNTWLASHGLVAMRETIPMPNNGRFDSEEDFIDATINGRWNDKETAGSEKVPCNGFWVIRGTGTLKMKRLCAKRNVLDNAGDKTMRARCSDPGDAVYVNSKGHTYFTSKVTLTDEMMTGANQPDGPMRIKWQVQSAMTGAWGAETWSDLGAANGGFFYDAQTSGADIADVASRVGDAFDGANSCNRDAVANYDQPGSSVWVAVDSTAPNTDAANADANTLTAQDVAVSVDSPQRAGATDFIAARGDVVTVVVTFDEQIDPNDAYAYYADTGRRIAPAQVYYDTVTYSLVVGTTIPATDGRLRLTIGPVSDVVGNAQANAFTTDVFADGATVTIQSVRATAAINSMWPNAGWGTAYSCVTESDNALDDGVVGPGHAFALTIKAATAMAVASATVAGAEVSDGTSRTVAVLATNPDNGVADAMLTVTRTVPVGDGDGFVDGASVAWSVSLVTETTCLSGAGTCPVTFEVTRCPAAGEDLSDGVVTSWERRVFVDLTPPTITSLRIASSANPELGAVVRDAETAAVTFVASEPLAVGGADASPPTIRLVTESCGAMEIAAARAVQLVAGTESTYEVAGDFAIVDPVADGACGASLVCVDFPAATDFADNALAGVVAGVGLCSGFGALLSNQQPGWLFFDNQAAPTAVQFEALPHSCADSSLSDAACAALSANTPLGIGSWMKVSYSSSVLAAMTSVAMGGVTHRTRLPAAGDDLALQGCRNVAPAAQCELFAARRGGCETFLCPDCAFRHGCDASCGYCQTGRGVAEAATAYVSTSDFPGLANGDRAVVLSLRTAGKATSAITTDTVAFKDYSAAVASISDASSSCAGKCGGAASSGCSCDPSCLTSGGAGECCADAGLCCDPGTPIDGATQPSGGCLLPPAVALTTEVTHWAERDDGVVTSLASPGSVVYVKVSANKPVDVLRATVGGVEVNPNNIAVEYDAGAIALERTSLAAGRAAYEADDTTGFIEARTNVERARGDLPPATIPWTPDAHRRRFPEIPDTRTSTIRVDGQALVPQPDGALRYVIELVEKTYAPFYTLGEPVATLEGDGPEWRNVPVIVQITGVKISGAGGAGAVGVGSEVQITITANEEVVVTNFVVETYRLTCKGSSYGGDEHGTCFVDPTIEPASFRNLADYRRTWVGARRFDERERMVLASGAIRVCAAVVDAAGNRGSTCENLANVILDVDPPAFTGAPTVVSTTPTSVDVAIEMSEPGVAKWKPLIECQVGQASAACDTQTGNTATNDVGVAVPRSPTIITVPVDAAWLSAPGDGVVRIEWELCDDFDNCGPPDPPFSDAVLPAAAAPTLAPTLNAVEPTTADVDLAHGSGGTTACWAVLEMAAPTAAADAPARTNAQVCSPTAAEFTSPIWCGGSVNQAHACDPVAADSTEPNVIVSQLTAATNYCLYTAPAGAPPENAAAALCFGTADDVPPAFEVIRGVSLGCDGDKIVGPACGMRITLVADECVTEPTVTLTYLADVDGLGTSGEDAMAALPAATRPTGPTISAGGGATSRAATATSPACDTHWTVAYGPGHATYMPEGNVAIRVDGCFDMAPFGAGDDDLSATQDPNPCPVETAWKGSDVRDVVVDTTAPTPTALVTDPDGASGTCALGGGDEVTITVTFDEATVRPTFTCAGAAVPAADVTVPGATAATATRRNTTWSAKCVVPPGLALNSPLEWSFAGLEDAYGNVNPTTYTHASAGLGSDCVIKSSKPLLTLADFDEDVIQPGATVALTLQFSEPVATPAVTIAGETVPAGAFAFTPDGDGNADAFVVTFAVPSTTPDGPWRSPSAPTSSTRTATSTPRRTRAPSAWIRTGCRRTAPGRRHPAHPPPDRVRLRQRLRPEAGRPGRRPAPDVRGGRARLRAGGDGGRRGGDGDRGDAARRRRRARVHRAHEGDAQRDVDRDADVDRRDGAGRGGDSLDRDGAPGRRLERRRLGSVRRLAPRVRSRPRVPGDRAPARGAPAHRSGHRPRGEDVQRAGFREPRGRGPHDGVDAVRRERDRRLERAPHRGVARRDQSRAG